MHQLLLQPILRAFAPDQGVAAPANQGQHVHLAVVEEEGMPPASAEPKPHPMIIVCCRPFAASGDAWIRAQLAHLLGL